MSTNENVGVAMGLVAAAGAATGLGASVVFIPSLVKLANRKVLAGSLGFSAGVMSYVSFVEIFPKALSSFESAGHDENKAYMYSTACFFCGVITMIILNMFVAKLLGGHSHRSDSADSKPRAKPSTRESVDAKLEKVIDTDVPSCCARDPVEQLDTFHRMASVLQHEMDTCGADAATPAESIEANMVSMAIDGGGGEENDEPDVEEDFVDNLPLDPEGDFEEAQDCLDEGLAASVPIRHGAKHEIGGNSRKEVHDDQTHEDHEKKKLVKMGLNTALAIGLHNFPEGLATFVAALADPKVGAVLAIAIAIHNIPEGLCVALPIYYATGSRLKGFLWALLSGASEIVAALLGWAILANTFSGNAYAILFGLVAGMMVIISVRELLPTAHFYDPDDTVVTYSFIGGMALMAFSLVLFKI